VIESMIYFDFEMSGRNLCEGCSLVSEIKSCHHSLKQAHKKLERYEESYKHLLGKDSEAYLSLIAPPIRAIQYYEEQIQILREKLSQIY